MKKKHIYFFIGTTAEFIKLAPIIKEFKRRKINFKLITSGQTKVHFAEFENYLGPIKVDIAFKERAEKPSIIYFLLWMLRTFPYSLFSLNGEFRSLNKTNSYFIVHGDTISSLIGALIAKIYHLSLVHIESGLRSFDFLEPFPEEVNRFIISHLADLRFCQNESAMKNVKNLKGININTKQNTLIETFLWANKKKKGTNNIKKFGKYYIVYIRRQEHIFFRRKWIKEILEFVIKNADKDLNCVFVCLGFVSKLIQPESLRLNKKIRRRLFLVGGFPYLDFMNLMSNAEFMASDGCTNQEETFYMGLPFLVLRHRLERIEGLGKNVIFSKGDKKLIKEFLRNYGKYRTKLIRLKERPSRIIVDYLFKN